MTPTHIHVAGPRTHMLFRMLCVDAYIDGLLCSSALEAWVYMVRDALLTVNLSADRVMGCGGMLSTLWSSHLLTSSPLHETRPSALRCVCGVGGLAP